MIEHLPSWVVPVTKEAYKSRKEIAGSWAKIVDRIKGKKIEIAVTGQSGAGKTVLLDHLTGTAYHHGYKPPGLSHSLETGKVPAKGFRLGVNAIPGQDSPPRFTAIAKVFEAKQPIDGLIHVVSNGFVSQRSPAARQVLVRDQGLDTIEKLRRNSLDEELGDLDETLRLVRASWRKSRKPTWMIVAVAKTDLFFDRLADAEQYYSPHGSGPFVDKMQQFMTQIGTDNFRWEAVPVAAWLEEFEWNNETQTCQMLPDLRDHFIGHFAETLEKHCGS